VRNASEIEQQIFCQTLWASYFLLGAQRLVKLTQGASKIGACFKAGLF